MRTIIFVSLCLCLVVSIISAEKSSHKHGDSKKLMKSGHESAALKLEHNPKSALPLKEELAGEHKPTGGRKHRNGKNKKGSHHGGGAEQQTGRARKPHSKSKANNNGPTKSHHNKHGRKGRGKQTQQ